MCCVKPADKGARSHSVDGPDNKMSVDQTFCLEDHRLFHSNFSFDLFLKRGRK